ncbi:MAG: hypothetical protein NTX53_07765 [candidate division WOR-3 bacterium]|nr:hypothetical protein [candidate division WOR-3 bacterium]MCX6842159.1 hypothetical protein [candidate division WOR-3 bacterium]
MMKKEYDFSKGVRGKFFRHRVKLNLPVYLDEEVFSFVQDIASKRKADASTVVNQLLRSNMDLARTIR